jgi:hypothetical protein
MSLLLAILALLVPRLFNCLLILWLNPISLLLAPHGCHFLGQFIPWVPFSRALPVTCHL